ncbi:MAG: DUF1553 domain-containing protein, partial [Verrucomicrobiales bacterium]|nr:DUF1553 domain-containing protein [Verrucomicrobiales bacterium]
EKGLKREGIGAVEKTRLEEEIAGLREGLEEVYEVMGVTEDEVGDVAVHLRGDYLTLGDVVARRVPEVLAGAGQLAVPEGQSGRVELARWIASAENPLTARVMANRVWRWHFGRGIVSTPDNFGELGERPTHPELLDYLAGVLVDSGWSVKALQREIMGSATYRQSAVAAVAVKEQDPENALYARWKPRRMESEVVRDSILAVSGRLDLSEGGSMLTVRANKYVDRKKLVEHAKSVRRTVYLPVLRSSGYEGQKAFDFPDPAMIAGDRKASTVAPQALYLMNSELVHLSAGALAERLEGETDEARVRWLVRRVLGREATVAEAGRGVGFVAAYGDGAWAGFARVLFASNEFLYIE